MNNEIKVITGFLALNSMIISLVVIWSMKSGVNFESIFDVSITKVNTAVLPTKKRRVGKSIGNRSVYKKAFVKLKEGDTINELFN